MRAAYGTKPVAKGHSIQAVKEHANRSLNINAFEKFCYKPVAQSSSSTAIAFGHPNQAVDLKGFFYLFL